MGLLDLVLRQYQHPRDHRIGQPRQLPRAVGRRLARIAHRHRNAEAQCLAHLVQRLQRRLDIALVGHRDVSTRGVQMLAVGQRSGDPRVQQFIQQQRVRRQPLGQQCAAADHLHQPRQRRRLLVEQRQVGATTQHVVQQREQATQRQHRLRRRRRALQQRRQHPVQPRAGAVGQVAHAGTAGEVAQDRVGVAGFDEAGIGQRLDIAAGPGVIVLQFAPVRGQRIGRRAAAARREQRVELGADLRAMRIQRSAQHRPVRMAKAERDPLAVLAARGQAMGLLVAQHLQAVLQLPQEPVGLGQRRGCLHRHVPRRHQRLQRRQQLAAPQLRLAAAADQLQRLHQEFDLADAAGPALDVVGQFLARDLGGNRRLHRAQAVERAEVQVTSIDKRPQRVEEAQAGLDVAGDRPRLLPGVALPVAAFVLEVLLHRRERPRHAAGIAVRAQAQVDAMAEAVGGDLVEQLRQLLAESGEVGLGDERPGAVRFAVAFKPVDEVDIGTEIELAATELAQCEHHQPLRLGAGAITVARAAAHHAVALGKLGLERDQRHLQAVLRQPGAAGQRLRDIVQAERVAPHQPRRFGRAMATQQHRPVAAVVAMQLRQRRGRMALVGEQRRQQCRLPRQGVNREITDPGDAADDGGHGRIGQRGGNLG